tara:strand:+ start:644 stop:895 length:252 start_codon:yes stop_codon:yes gene_type:complete
MYKDVLYSVCVSVVLNILLPFVVKPFATKDQISPPNGAVNLSYFDQLMHMLVHHAQVPITSSAIVALIVFLSVGAGKLLAKHH